MVASNKHFEIQMSTELLEMWFVGVYCLCLSKRGCVSVRSSSAGEVLSMVPLQLKDPLGHFVMEREILPGILARTALHFRFKKHLAAMALL